MWRRLGRGLRERGPDAVADWLILVGGVGLFCSLFLTWSHQVSPAIASAAERSGVLQRVARDPTGWQLYSIVDVLMAVLAGVLVTVSLAVDSVRARVVLVMGCALAVVFVLHALSVPPTNGVLLSSPATGNYVRRAATAGVGETVALAALGVGMLGLAGSLARR